MEKEIEEMMEKVEKGELEVVDQPILTLTKALLIELDKEHRAKAKAIMFIEQMQLQNEENKTIANDLEYIKVLLEGNDGESEDNKI